MYRTLSFSGLLLNTLFVCLLVGVEERITYAAPPEAVRQDGVPQGQLIPGTFRDSRIFPGTERDYWVYLPAQLAAESPPRSWSFKTEGYCSDNGDRAQSSSTI